MFRAYGSFGSPMGVIVPEAPPGGVDQPYSCLGVIGGLSSWGLPSPEVARKNCALPFSRVEAPGWAFRSTGASEEFGRDDGALVGPVDDTGGLPEFELETGSDDGE